MNTMLRNIHGARHVNKSSKDTYEMNASFWMDFPSYETIDKILESPKSFHLYEYF